MKQITFKTFEDFLKAELKTAADEKILYYSRLYGNRDWGFSISTFFNKDYDNSGELSDYMQVQFLTHDIEFAPSIGEMIANPKRKIMTLKGNTAENYYTACRWIEEQRATLLLSVQELKGAENPLIDKMIKEELAAQEVVE